MASQLQSVSPQFAGSNGLPLDNGYVYIGTANLNPETSPIAIYWDAAGTIPAAQPLRTVNGYISRNGATARVYVSASTYSITVREASNALVLSFLDSNTFEAAFAASTGASLVGYLQSGVGAVAQTVQGRLRQFFTVKDFGAVGDGVTDDTTVVQAAITAAVAASKALWFPDGVYLITGTLTDFHTVVKFGPGYVSRSGVSFAITPKSTETNILNVATTGNDSNDGLGTSQAFLTLQAALNALATYGPYLPGTWKINMAAGRYAAGATIPANLHGANWIEINGVSGALPFTPTSIIGAAVPTAGSGLIMNGGNNIIVRNIYFDNWSGGTSHGVVCQDLSSLYTINCYFNLCDNAIKAQQSRLYVDGGIITGGQVGVTSISGNTHTIGYNATVAGTTGGAGMGPYINGCTVSGILVQENSTGHADYCTINNSAVGADVVSSSRLHALGSAFTNNVTAGIRTRGSSWWFNNSSTFTTNGVNWLQYATTQELGNYGTAVAELRTAYSNTTAALTGTVAQTTMVAAVGAGVLDRTLVWTGKSLRFRVYGSFAGGVGTKTLRLYIGANILAGVTSVVSSTAQFSWEVRINAMDAGNQRVTSFLLDNTSTTSVASSVTTTAFSMATGATQVISITGELSSAADTITINEVEMWETA